MKKLYRSTESTRSAKRKGLVTDIIGGYVSTNKSHLIEYLAGEVS